MAVLLRIILVYEMYAGEIGQRSRAHVLEAFWGKDKPCYILHVFNYKWSVSKFIT